ncbi:MAG: hypothetical protein NT166_30345, partial [Candidatus Aminicenantes bacterium]|nr:hypothetical protein [Candidatus Aminicenantes bacterium]
GAAFEIAVTGNENAGVLFLRASIKTTCAEDECDAYLPLSGFLPVPSLQKPSFKCPVINVNHYLLHFFILIFSL